MVGSAETRVSGRKGSTPSGTTSQHHRPQAPKRAHTSAVNTATVNSAKRPAQIVEMTAGRRTGTPLLMTQTLQSHGDTAPKTPSPNYFALVVEPETSNPNDSDAGKHAKKNWAPNSSASSAREIPVEENPQFESFKKRSEQNTAFRLAHSNLSRFSTDGRVPTLRTLNGTGGIEQHVPLSAGGRLPGLLHSNRGDDAMDTDHVVPERQRANAGDAPSFFDIPMQESPRPKSRSQALGGPSGIDALPHRGSLPQTRVATPLGAAAAKPRAETLPSQLDSDAPKLIFSSELSQLLSSKGKGQVLLLDLRVAPQYAQSRIRGALNLCLPTTLLKRPAFNIQRLAETFTSLDEKARFETWRDASHIVVYDACSVMLKDAQSSINTLRKFQSEGYQGIMCIVKGGFHLVSQQHPNLIETVSTRRPGQNPGLKLSIGPSGRDAGGEGTQVAGGCPMPAQQPANPFFGNIRQNMDLVDGVGQMPIKRPSTLTDSNLRDLPSWLRDVVDEEDEGKLASEKFLKIEQTEQKRMQQALSGDVQYGTPMPADKIKGEAKQGRVQVAGIEKGSKNRYKDMLPYEHARVHLRHCDSDGCDYINASHVKAEWSHRRYIATQAPVPATFKDFWRLVWEQDVRVLVMLTAEMENGQRKCHRYWEPDSYGPFKLKQLSEKRVNLELPSRPSLTDSSRKASMPLTPLHDQRRFQRRATLALNADEADRPLAPGGTTEKEAPFCVVRKLALSNVHEPFRPMREIAHVEYTNWPDFGAPAEPSELLGLVARVDAVVRGSENGGRGGLNSHKDDIGFSNSLRNDDVLRSPAVEGEHPIVVHCSAGCGRSGTFITVDAVIDMLKRQRAVATKHQGQHNIQSGYEIRVPHTTHERETDPFDMLSSPTSKAAAQVDAMDLDDTESESSSRGENSGTDGEGEGSGSLDEQDWVTRDDVDLVQKTVEDLRLQRLSMVQNLRQFTLCYESVIEWLVREMPERFRKDHFRKSYHG